MGCGERGEGAREGVGYWIPTAALIPRPHALFALIRHGWLGLGAKT